MTNRVLTITERGIEIHTIKKNTNEIEIYHFSDTIKFVPNDERADEFTINIQKLNIKETYYCTHLQDLIANYIKALDCYLLSRQAVGDDLKQIGEKLFKANEQDNEAPLSPEASPLKPRMEATEIGPLQVLETGQAPAGTKYSYVEYVRMAMSNIGLREYYNVKMTVHRSFIRVELQQTDESLGSSLELISEIVQDVGQRQAGPALRHNAAQDQRDHHGRVRFPALVERVGAGGHFPVPRHR